MTELVGWEPENNEFSGEFLHQFVHHRVVPLGGISEGGHIHHQNHLALILAEVYFLPFQSLPRKLVKIVNLDRAFDAGHVWTGSIMRKEKITPVVFQSF